MNKVILFVVTLLISCQTKESNTSYHDEPVVINCDSIKEQHIEELKQYTVSIPVSYTHLRAHETEADLAHETGG